jgi:YD repeat-containing protein
VEPNFTRTKIYDVDGKGNNTVSTSYTDGLSRGIQSKVQLSSTGDRVSCTYYDEAGRPSLATKPFIDTINNGRYLPGTITDSLVRVQLETGNAHDTCAYSETKYRDDPLGRVRTTVGPGEKYREYGDTAWTFGVSREDKSITLTSTGTVTFEDGVITAITPAASMAVSAVLDELYDTLLTDNPFTNDQNHILTLSLSIDGSLSTPETRISEELKDLFGRTVRTFSAPTVGSATGSRIGAAYVHDILGNVLVEQPPVANRNPIADSKYAYNTRGQLIKKVSPDGGVFTYEYYRNGLQKDVILRKSDGTKDWGLAYEYDHLGRKTAIKEVFYGHADWTPIRFFYDDTGNIPRHYFSTMPAYLFDELKNLKGRPVATVITNRGDKNIHVGELYSYDDEGRVVQKYLSISGFPTVQMTCYEYDIHGKATAEYFHYGADHIKKRFTYDHLGRLEYAIQDLYDEGLNSYPDSQVLFQYTYNDLGQLWSKKLSATNVFPPYKYGYIYDIHDRVSEITKPPTQVGFSEAIEVDDGTGTMISGYSIGGNVLNARFTYQPTSIHDTLRQKYAYSYDDVNRLTAATKNQDGAVTHHVYGYDAVGRITGKKEGDSEVSRYEYYTASNRLKRTNRNPMAGKEYVFDKRGNMVVDYTKNMVIEYDWRDLPVAYRFFDDLTAAGITKNGTTGTSDITNLDGYMKTKVTSGAVELIATVVMVYDAGGNRVAKMEVKE